MRHNIAFNFKFNFANVTKNSIKGEKTMKRILIILALTGFIGACEERVNPARSWERCRSSGINEFVCIFHPIGDIVAEPIRLMNE